MMSRDLYTSAWISDVVRRRFSRRGRRSRGAEILEPVVLLSAARGRSRSPEVVFRRNDGLYSELDLPPSYDEVSLFLNLKNCLFTFFALAN